MPSRESRARILLWIGAALGLALAVGSLAMPSRRGGSEVPPGAVAVVNGIAIPKGDYDRALQALSEGAGRTPTREDKRGVIERLVEDELLVERGLELGMVRGDIATRRALVGAVLAAERGAAEGRAPTDDELGRYYARIRRELERPGRVHVRQIVVRAAGGSDEDAVRVRARDAVRRLRSGEAFEGVRAELGSPMEKAIPDEAIAVDVLRSLIGPVVLERVLTLAPGEVTEPLGAGGVLRVVQLVEKRPPEIPSFEEARADLLQRYRQDAADEALAAKLRALRDAARIGIVSAPP